MSDTQNKSIEYSNKWNNNNVSYLNNGGCYVDGPYIGKFGSGFKEGEIVTVAIDLKSGKIQWKVENKVRH